MTKRHAITDLYRKTIMRIYKIAQAIPEEDLSEQLLSEQLLDESNWVYKAYGSGYWVLGIG